MNLGVATGVEPVSLRLCVGGDVSARGSDQLS